MKTYLVYFACLFLGISCNNSRISKPDTLIDQAVMVDIIYDLSLLEGVKNYNSSRFQSIKPNEFIFKKYKIDSIQFAKSTQYYAATIVEYKDIYDEVGKRIEKNKAHIDSIQTQESKNFDLTKKELKK